MNGSSRFFLGFTLVELIITIAVAAILLGVGVPSFQQIIKSNRMTANVNEFIGALNLARSEAIKQGLDVTVCKGSGNSCDPNAVWGSGWIVFANRIGLAETFSPVTGACLSNEDCLLRVYPAIGSGYTFDGNQPVTNRVTYNSRGMSDNVGTLILCDDRGIGEHARAIRIARTGRAQAMKATDARDPRVESCSI